MFNSVVDLLTDSTAATTAIPALPVALTAFQTQVDALPGLALAQAQPTTGVTTDKQAALQAMADAAFAVAQGVKGHATKRKLGDLGAKVDAPSSAFTRGRELDRITLAQQVHAAANKVVADLTDFAVTAADLTDLAQKIAAARVALNAPRAVAGAKKSATQQLPEAFHHADDILQNQLDPLAAKLAEGHVDFYPKYQAARVIIDRSGGHASPGATPPTPPARPRAEANSVPAATVVLYLIKGKRRDMHRSGHDV